MRCNVSNYVNVVMGSDFKLVITLKGKDGETIAPESVKWGLSLASYNRLRSTYDLTSDDLGVKWVGGTDNSIVISIPAANPIAEGDLYSRLSTSSIDGSFDDGVYDVVGVWQPVIHQRDDAKYVVRLVSSTSSGGSDLNDIKVVDATLSVAKGDVGKSAYESALDGGFVGSEEEFNEALGSRSQTIEALEAVLKEPIQNSGEGFIKLSTYLENERNVLNPQINDPIEIDLPLRDRADKMQDALGRVENLYSYFGFKDETAVGGALDKIVEQSYEITKDWTSYKGNLDKTARFLPVLDVSNLTTFNGLFSGFSRILAAPNIDFPDSIKDFSSMYSGCGELLAIPSIVLNRPITLARMFFNCFALVEHPPMNCAGVSNFEEMYLNCQSIKEAALLNVDRVYSMDSMFRGCLSLETVPAFNAQLIKTTMNIFFPCYELTHFGGLIGIKVSYSLASSPKLTHESLMNAINGLADLSGTKAQTLSLGDVNLAKLTVDDRIIATRKNWILN